MKERIIRRIQELRVLQANCPVSERAYYEREIARLFALIK
jgi:hypothetical protein